MYFLLQKMQKGNLINLKAEKIEVDGQSRLKIAIKAAQLGADLQRIGDLLRWQEFEEIAAEALKIINGTQCTITCVSSMAVADTRLTWWDAENPL
jgi:hypothetical protein